jgi:hypothetical protein
MGCPVKKGLIFSPIILWIVGAISKFEINPGVRVVIELASPDEYVPPEIMIRGSRSHAPPLLDEGIGDINIVTTFLEEFALNRFKKRSRDERIVLMSFGS